MLTFKNSGIPIANVVAVVQFSGSISIVLVYMFLVHFILFFGFCIHMTVAVKDRRGSAKGYREQRGTCAACFQSISRQEKK